MKVSSVFALLLTTGLLTGEAKAGWIKNAVEKVVNFVKERCHFNTIKGITFGCTFNFDRKKRSVGSGTESDLSDVDEATGFDCGSLAFPSDAVPRRVFEEAFEQLDGDQDEQLDDKEMAQYKAATQIFDDCVKKQRQE